MTWLDFVLLALVAVLTVIGAKRKVTGFLVGVAGLILFRFLLVISANSVALGLVFAISAGLLLGFAGRALVLRKRGPAIPVGVLGGFGGFALGMLLLLLTITSLPIERNLNNQLVYPPQSLPASLRSAVTGSRLVALGRDILFYPLLSRDGATPENPILSGLHAFLIVGEPWERGS